MEWWERGLRVLASLGRLHGGYEGYGKAKNDGAWSLPLLLWMILGILVYGAGAVVLATVLAAGGIRAGGLAWIMLLAGYILAGLYPVKLFVRFIQARYAPVDDKDSPPADRRTRQD